MRDTIRSDSKVMIRVQQKSTATVINFNEIVARAHTREGTEYKSSHERTRGGRKGGGWRGEEGREETPSREFSYLYSGFPSIVS